MGEDDAFCYWVNEKVYIPSFSSRRGHVTEKHVLTGRKHDRLGNQTFEILTPVKQTFAPKLESFRVC